MQSQGDLDDVLRRTIELRHMCAQARAEAAALTMKTAVLLAIAAETRETALRFREATPHRQAHRMAVVPSSSGSDELIPEHPRGYDCCS